MPRIQEVVEFKIPAYQGLGSWELRFSRINDEFRATLHYGGKDEANASEFRIPFPDMEYILERLKTAQNLPS